MKDKFKHAFMDVAERFAQLSSATRANVGCIIVKDDNRIISIGYNGMPSGWDNCCEDVVRQDEVGFTLTKTKPEVLHAETNAIAKVACSTDSCKDATLFCTHSPCIDCAKLIYQSGITTVYFKHDYTASSSPRGIDFLEKSGVTVQQIEENTDEC